MRTVVVILLILGLVLPVVYVVLSIFKKKK